MDAWQTIEDAAAVSAGCPSAAALRREYRASLERAPGPLGAAAALATRLGTGAELSAGARVSLSR